MHGSQRTPGFIGKGFPCPPVQRSASQEGQGTLGNLGSLAGETGIRMLKFFKDEPPMKSLS